ncbi:unnamed protein product [Ambrosiozyma monospora]|uniref:Unnamed protein product n=1 Tax=Ambrosiozyma monospora TaxID=43982 RepID=A0ACB5T242_AMBMO|nr:unnamed protein product [Ambrosiozyma monospora]
MGIKLVGVASTPTSTTTPTSTSTVNTNANPTTGTNDDNSSIAQRVKREVNAAAGSLNNLVKKEVDAVLNHS